MRPCREAPFYGVHVSSWLLCTLDGLCINDRFQVLNGDDEPIEGLYAIGNCCGGRYALTYPGILAGNSIGMAMTNGYVCGQVVAAL